MWRWGADQPINGNTPIYIASVDGTHCRVNEPRKTPNSQWYSHKFNKAALTYEVAIDLYESKIVWINGAYPAGQSDAMVFQKEQGLKSMIPAGLKVIADNGYQGQESICAPNLLDCELLSKFKSRARARHETINSRLKSFRILSDVFRQDHIKHHIVFDAVAVVVQYDMENGYPLFSIV